MKRLLLLLLIPLCVTAWAQTEKTPKEERAIKAMIRCMKKTVIALDDGTSSPEEIGKAFAASGKCRAEFEYMVTTSRVTPEMKQKTRNERDELFENIAANDVWQRRREPCLEEASQPASAPASSSK